MNEPQSVWILLCISYALALAIYTIDKHKADIKRWWDNQTDDEL